MSLHNPGIVVADLIERRDNPIHRHYRYDAGGELVALRDKLRGDTHYAYDRAGRLLGRSAPDLTVREHFAYDAAANLVQPEGDALGGHLKDNRLRTWQDQRYDYDAENHLIHAATYRDGNLVSQGRYHYDSLGRRIAKIVERDGDTTRTDFLWQGLRLLQERSGEQSSLYIYEPDSYAPLARIDGSGDDARLYYFHTDQIGTPLNVTDEDGQMVWQASYKAWGEVEQYHTQAIEQNLRFQGQYFDDETGLHYNTFRYYDPGVGRFVTQDPIGLAGGVNFYLYGSNPNQWIDPLGWCSTKLGNNMGARPGDGMANHHLIPEEVLKNPQYSKMFDRLKSMGFDGDGASNGAFLPGSRELTQKIGTPGHWSSHAQYTSVIEPKVSALNNLFNSGKLSDTQLALGIGKIQNFAREGLMNGKFSTDPITGRLL